MLERERGVRDAETVSKFPTREYRVLMRFRSRPARKGSYMFPGVILAPASGKSLAPRCTSRAAAVPVYQVSRGKRTAIATGIRRGCHLLWLMPTLRAVRWWWCVEI